VLLSAGAVQWYVAAAGPATAVLRLDGGIVSDVAIAPRALTGTVARDRSLISSF